MSASPGFAIDAITGQITGNPNLIGQFVVGVCVREYRKGILLKNHFRDFQFNIRSCIPLVLSDSKNKEVFCDGNAITFTNLSQSNFITATDLWNFGVTTQNNDTSLVFSPSFTFPDTGKFTVTLITNPRQPCSGTTKKNIYVYPPLDISF